MHLVTLTIYSLYENPFIVNANVAKMNLTLECPINSFVAANCCSLLPVKRKRILNSFNFNLNGETLRNFSFFPETEKTIPTNVYMKQKNFSILFAQ